MARSRWNRRAAPAVVVVLAATTVTVAGPVTAGGVAEAAPVQLAACASSDNGFPDLQSVMLSPSWLDVRRRAARLTVTATATDDGGPGRATGVRAMEVTLTGGLNLDLPVKLVRQDDGTWQGQVQVPRGARPGTQSVRFLRLSDWSGTGNSRWYTADDLRGMGQSIDVDVIAHRDRQGPQLESLALSRTSVDLSRSAQTVRVRARVTDDIAGTSQVALETDVGGTELRLRSGTRLDGVWTGTLRISRWNWVGGSPYALFFVLRDRAGQDRSLYSDDLVDLGLPSTLTVTSSSKDTVDPRVRRVTIEPATVDVTDGDADVAVTVRAADAKSGIGRTSVWTGLMKRISGTAHDGVWRDVTTVDSCTARSQSFRPQVVVFDRANNRVTARTRLTIVNDKDIKPPSVRNVEPYRATPSEPVTFAFTEDVTGITTTSAPVRRTEPGVGFGTDDPPAPQAGTWTCANSSGAPADCATGAVRTATWSPSQPLTAGHTYGVDFNPEHVLDVMDLSGNPMDPYLRYEDEFAPTWSVQT